MDILFLFTLKISFYVFHTYILLLYKEENTLHGIAQAKWTWIKSWVRRESAFKNNILRASKSISLNWVSVM